MAQFSALLYGAQAVNNLAAAYSDAQAAKAEGDYTKRIYDLNARISNIQAADAVRRGEEEARAANRKSGNLVSRQRAAAAGQGIDVNVGAPADLVRDESLMNAVDQITIRNNAYREAWGYRVQASDYESRGKMAALEGRRRRRQTLLTGGLNAALDFARAGYSMTGSSGSRGSISVPTRTNNNSESGTYTG